MYKVERKPTNPNATWYEVMLSPFNTYTDAEQYIEKYQKYYPIDDRNFKITKIAVGLSK